MYFRNLLILSYSQFFVYPIHIYSENFIGIEDVKYYCFQLRYGITKLRYILVESITIATDVLKSKTTFAMLFKRKTKTKYNITQFWDQHQRHTDLVNWYKKRKNRTK